MIPKKYLKTAVYFIAATMLFGACSNKEKDPDTLSVSPSTLQFTFDGKVKDQKVTVTTNAKSWDATKGTNDGWITIDKGDGSFTVNVSEWKGNENRTGTITVTAGDAEAKTISVTQVKPGANTLTVTPASVTFDAFEEEKKVTVATSAESWSFVDPAKTWLVLQKDNNDLKISLSALNFGAENLTAEVVVKAERATDVTLTITVKPSINTLSISNNALNFEAYEADVTKNVTVTTDANSWSISDVNKDWLDVTKDGNKLNVKMTKENTGNQPLTAEITISAGSAEPKTLTITVGVFLSELSVAVLNESVTTDGKSFKKAVGALRKNSTITLVGELASDDVVVNLDFFQRVNTSSVKFLGESGKYTLLYNADAKIVTLTVAEPDYPDYLIGIGNGYCYPSKVEDKGLYLPGYAENSRSTDYMRYTVFRKTGDMTYQTTFMARASESQFKVFHATGKGDITKGWGNGGEYKYNDINFSGINLFPAQNQHGDYLFGGDINEGKVYRMTVTITEEKKSANINIEEIDTYFAWEPEVEITLSVSEINSLLGGDNANGKNWKLGPWSSMRNPENHPDKRNEVWWNFYESDGGVVQESVFTFKPNGDFTHVNNGKTLVNEELRDVLPGNTDPKSSYVTTGYTPATDATWDVEEKDGELILSIKKGFLAYPTCLADLEEAKYALMFASNKRIRFYSKSGWDGWCFEIVPQK